MKICKIYLFNYQQFKELELDFTHPETGEPLDKICFIGRNGTGKTTLLHVIRELLYQKLGLAELRLRDGLPQKMIIKFELDNGYYYASHSYGPHCFNSTVDQIENWKEEIFLPDFGRAKEYEVTLEETGKVLNKITFNKNSADLLTYVPATTGKYSFSKDLLPSGNLNTALEYFKDFPFQHTVSSGLVSDFWNILIYQIKKRENDFNEFQNKGENQNKTVKEIREEFEKISPKILDKLAEIWNKILEKAGLEFDVENAKNPIQLNDNLKAYIRLKSTKQVINYNQLSAGIQDFIFKIGHIYSLYFNREIKRGFLLIDEPENSLYPDFLFDLVDIYKEVIKDKNGHIQTQMFMATHNPIIASQFEPYEKIILEFDEEANVTAHKGTAPVGDDPNDILTEDFNSRILGKEGEAMWRKYLDMKKQLRVETDEKKKDCLLAEINDIGRKYNF